MGITEGIFQAACTGLFVAIFLLNTGRPVKAIEVCKECSIFLNSIVVKLEEEIFNLLYIGTYTTIFRAYCLIPDHTEALIYGRKLLEIYRQCGKKEEEGNLTILLANMYRQHYRYLEAMELYVTAINLTKEMGDRKNEAYTNEKVGIIPQRFCLPFVRVIHFNRNESFSSFLAFILLGLRFFLPSGFSVKMKTAYKSSQTSQFCYFEFDFAVKGFVHIT